MLTLYFCTEEEEEEEEEEEDEEGSWEPVVGVALD